MTLQWGGWGLFLAIVAALGLSACDPADQTLGRQCVFNYECNTPLICAGQFCRAQCATDRDCHSPETCHASDNPGKSVCLAPSLPALCVADTDCPQPRGVCVRGTCYASCATNAQCSSGVGLDAEPAVCVLESPVSHCARPIAVSQENADASFPPIADVGVESGFDAGIDAGTDAGIDVGMDAGTDAGTDVGIDAGTDAGFDVASDVPHEPSCDVMCSGRCADLSSDLANCGACGHSCGTAVGGTIACVAGTCGAIVCNPGLTLCGAGCYDLGIATQHCGSCSNSCPVACSAGACVTATNIYVSSAGATSQPTTFIARLSDGTLRAWGAGNWIGPPTSFPIPRSATPVPFNLPGLTADDQLVVGAGVLCAYNAILQSVRCAGRNDHGVLGNGTTDASPTLTTPMGISNVLGIALSDSHACVWRPESHLGAGDRVVCWGDNTAGQLGDGTTSTTPRTTPDVTHPAGSIGLDIVTVAVGSAHSCAVETDGNIYCWGDNTFGQLGLDPATTPFSLTPVAATNVDVPAPTIVATDRASAELEAYSNSYAEGWGENSNGNAGPNPAFGLVSYRAYQIQYVCSQVAISPTHACAIHASADPPQTLSCWGSNAHGELGRFAPLVPAYNGCSPTLLSATSTTGFRASDVALGSHVTCAIAAPPTGDAGTEPIGGAVYCWGLAANGALGNGVSTDTGGPGLPVAF